jgi:hypothetical protein
MISASIVGARRVERGHVTSEFHDHGSLTFERSDPALER